MRLSNWSNIKNLQPTCILLALLTLENDKNRVTGKVYRGANHPEELLEFYTRSKNRYFTWYSFALTSMSLDVATSFLNSGFAGTVPVILEIKLNNSIGIDAAEFSDHPEDQEVLLPPCTIFEIINQAKLYNGTVIISLKCIEKIM